MTQREEFRPFRLEGKQPGKYPVVRLKPAYYLLLQQIKGKTGIPMGNILEQALDYALGYADDEAIAWAKEELDEDAT